MNQDLVCHGDCGQCGHDGRYIPPPEGPTPRCSKCGVKMIKKGEKWVCWKCLGTEQMAPFEFLPRYPPAKQTTPQDELERAQKIIRRARGLDEETELSVGDLSFVETSKRKNRVQDGIKALENMERGLTVGDQSFASAHKDPTELDNLYVGQGAYVASSMSESQEIQAEMMAKRRKDQEEVFRIRQIMIDQQREKELRHEAHLKGVAL